MLGGEDNFPVLVVRSPDRALPVADLSKDQLVMKATASTDMCAGRKTRFSLPPSPPYTNPHLKRAIPLPLLDEGNQSSRTMQLDPTCLVENIKDNHFSVVPGSTKSSDIPSPPDSSRIRNLSLPSVDEVEEVDQEYCSFDNSGKTLLESNNESWSDGEMSGGSQLLEISALEKLVIDDAHDDSIFLDAPDDLRSSLNLNLYGGPFNEDHINGGSSSSLLGYPSSPRLPSTSLLELNESATPSSEPLFDPSCFDVFNNDWDAASISDARSSDGTISHTTHDQFESVNSDGGPFTFPPNSSPRRYVVDLPDDDSGFESSSDTLLDPPSDEECFQLRGRSSRVPLLKRTVSTRPKHYSDIPPDTPFCVPILVGDYDDDITTTSENMGASKYLQDFSTSAIGLELPLHTLEENRLCSLFEQTSLFVKTAQDEEGGLSKLVSYLSSLPIPAKNCSEPLFISGEAFIPESLRSCCFSQDPAQVSDIQEVTFVYSDPSTFEAVCRREIKDANAIRSMIRQRRKLAKERVNEVKALLDLKSQIFKNNDLQYSTDFDRFGYDTGTSTTVYSFSGPKENSSSGSTTTSNNDISGHPMTEDPRTAIKHLVAKMIFRRRDTSRPLSSRNVSGRFDRYSPSTLRKALQADNEDEDNEDEGNDVNDIFNEDYFS